MTADPFSVSHHNAFPLRMHPHTQGNGAPVPGPDPYHQVRRLAEWDGGSEKLVQQNHPDIGWVFFDANEDGVRDEGFGLLPYEDVMEVYATNILKMEAVIVHHETGWDNEAPGWKENNRVFNWLQLLNQGVRLPGVANSDAHINFHGSGGVRNYVRSASDEPSRIDPMDIVRSAKAGHVIMTNGPFLEVTVTALPPAPAGSAIPGDTLAAPGGRVRIHARVQCPGWIDIDRVAILLNGRLSPAHLLTRYTHPRMFGAGPAIFDQSIEVDLAADTHIIVVAAHKLPVMQPVMGPVWGAQAPVAIANPIFVDVDGGGFQANGDTLDHPLPARIRNPHLPRP